MQNRLLMALALSVWLVGSACAGLLSPEQRFLKPDQAFDVHVTSVQGHVLTLRFHVAPGYYLYRDKIHIVAKPPAQIGALRLPPAQIDNIPFYGKTWVYAHSFNLKLPLTGISDLRGTVLEASFQGCAVNGICYPPRTKTLPVSFVTRTPGLPASGGPPQRTLWLELLAAFGTGLLLTFTPCVLPMIPILSSIVVGQGTRPTRGRAVALSVAYVLGTATTYAAIGALAGETGNQLQAYFENAWGIGVLSALLIVLALSMFGLFEIQLPSALQSRLQGRAGALRGGSLAGSYILGLMSALIVGACVSPLLISALGLAISQHSPALGAELMFFMALGMGVILIGLGLGAGFLLPKAGAWMNQVKRIFGFLLLGVVIYLLSGLRGVPVLWLWSLWLVSLGVFLGASQPLAQDAAGIAYAAKGVGTFALLWGALALFGAVSGGRDVLHPLAHTFPPASVVAATPAAPASTAPPTGDTGFLRVTTVAQTEALLAQARAQHRPAFIDFYASWCTDCVRLERETFSDPPVQQALRRFVRIQADVTRNDAASLALKRHFGVYGPPALLFFNAHGKEQRPLRAYGFTSPAAFLRKLAEVRR
ncbi:MAG: protein-disulfide reductase DsbD [Acidiferrobacteraceae bacterium]